MRWVAVGLTLLLFSSCQFIGRTVINKESTTVPGSIKKNSSQKKKNKIRVKNKIFCHTVKKGETLYRISKNYGISIERIAYENNIFDNRTIYAGQTLRIPLLKKKDKKKSNILKDEPDISNGHTFLKSWPLKNHDRRDIIKKYGKIYNKELGVFTNNNGIDLKVKSREIVTVKSGKVEYIDFLKGIGMMIGIHLDNSYFVFYYPCKNIRVKKEENVKTGEIIADTSGDILHFEVRKNKIALNPLLFLP